jgi:SAM-dependent methyltransferase
MEQEVQLRQKARNQLQQFLAECKITDYRNKRILEIGFKNGLFVDECQKAGLIPTGLEINKGYYETVKARFPYLDLIWYDGSTIPVSDNSFDFVVSFQVLEHAGSTEHMFDECIRILKPGGIMYHVCPNYHSFYEGHYNIIWLPFLNKTTGRLYLKLLGRFTPYFESLNLIKPSLAGQALKKYNNITVISLGKREFVNNFNTEQIEKVNQKFLRTILGLLVRAPLLKKTALGLFVITNLYYPITVIARKN